MKQQHNTTTNSNYALYKKFIYTGLVTLTICAALVFYLPLALTPAAFAILSIFIITTSGWTISKIKSAILMKS